MDGYVFCEICGVLVEASKYHGHNKYAHTEKKDNSCNLCGKTFTSAYNLQYHIAHHVNARSFVCDECSSAYNTASDLAQHKKKAHDRGRASFDCRECAMCFDARSKLNAHIKVHKNAEKPPPVQQKDTNIHFVGNVRYFKCSFCDKKFGRNSDLNRHINSIHKNLDINIRKSATKPPPVEPKAGAKKCPICEKSFMCLSKHNKIVHMNIRNYGCSFCDKKFSKKAGLDRHIIAIHTKEKNFKCDECGRKFGEERQLKSHQRTHLLTYCVRCREHFEDIKLHNEEKHSDLKHSCETCHKVFGRFRELRVHIKSKHTTVRSYLCDHCGKGFVEKFQIKRHMKIHEGIFIKKTMIKKEEENNVNKIDERFSPESDNEFSADDRFSPDLMDRFSPELEDTLQVLMKIKKETVDNDINFINCQPIYGGNIKEEPQMFEENGPENNSSKGKGNKIICDICGSQFTYKYIAQKHMESIHKKIKHECAICYKTFTFKNTLYTHTKVVHQKKREHECVFCNKKFGVKYALSTHIKTVHCENPAERERLECDLCDKSFLTNSSLYNHKKCVHEKVKRPRKAKHPCKICHEPFETRHLNLTHMIHVHLNGTKLKRTCGYCKQEFDLYEDFKSHIDSHNGVYVCMVCDKFYFDKESLKTHKKLHKKVDIKYRNYVCDHCGERLLTKLQLQVHIKKHAKNYNLHYCDYCGKGFKFVSSLYTHRIYHEEGRFNCEYCTRKFVRKTELDQHIRTHTNEKPFICEICNRAFVSKTLLKLHTQTHPESHEFKCRECPQMFTTGLQLAAHENQFHPELRQHTCTLCNMSFKQKHHLKKHTLRKHQ